ncbi:MAG: hypothetical protein JWN41_510 [Thermoleophilia bacterium]|nr:hypothetical protein [Thermoleophilia bacterium]
MTDRNDDHDGRIDALLTTVLIAESGAVNLDPLAARILDDGNMTDRAAGRPARSARQAAARPRRGRAVGMLVAASIVALAIVAAVAIAPDRLGRASHGVAAPRSAAAKELLAAGASAGDAPWKPLSAGQYAYVHVLGYAPSSSLLFAPTSTEPGSGLSPTYPGPWSVNSSELWISPDGRARESYVLNARVHAKGAARPTTLGTREIMANTSTWDGVSPLPRQRFGVVKGNRFVVQHDAPANPKSHPRQTTKLLMFQFWSASFDQINSLPAGGAELDRAVDQLIRTSAEKNPFVNELQMLYNGITRDQVRHEAQVEQATYLLGAAPLPPAARRAVFKWLASATGAHLEGITADHLGRRGTTVSFTANYKMDTAARKMTDQQLIDQLVERGATRDEIGVTPTGQTFDVGPLHADRHWSTSVIFDTSSGELLQSTRIENDHYAAAPVVQKGWNVDHTRQAPHFVYTRVANGRGGAGAGAYSRVYVDRAVTTDTVPREPMCQKYPTAC